MVLGRSKMVGAFTLFMSVLLHACSVPTCGLDVHAVYFWAVTAMIFLWFVVWWWASNCWMMLKELIFIAVTQHTTHCCSMQVVDITLMKLHSTNITSLRVIQQKYCGSTNKLLLLQAQIYNNFEVLLGSSRIPHWLTTYNTCSGITKSTTKN
jgi:hypothetical protein